MAILYNVCYYLIEIVKLYLVVFVLIGYDRDQKVKPHIVLAICSAILAIVRLFDPSSFVMSLISAFLQTVTVFSFLRHKRDVSLVVLCIILLSLCDSLIAGMLCAILDIEKSALLQENLTGLLVNAASTPVVFILAFTVSKIRSRKVKNIDSPYDSYQKLSIKNIVLLVIGGVSATIYLIPIQSLALVSPDNYLGYSMLSVITASGIIFILICAMYIFSINKSDKYRFERNMYRTLLQKQEEYYKSLLDREEQTRKLRHDITQHISVVSQLLEKKQIELANEYLSELTGRTQPTKSIVDTGNDVLNIVINDVWERTENIDLEWKGNLPNNIKLTDMEICILFSNIMRNAVEGAEKCGMGKYVHVNLKQLGSTLFFKTTNPTDGQIFFKHGRPISRKKLEGLHGVGLINVEEVVEKYHGSITYLNDDENNIFTIEIILEDIFN